VLRGYEVWGSDVVTDYPASNYCLIDSVNSDFTELFRHQQFDLCINCSGAASVPESLLNPFRDYTLNTLNVFKLLDALRRFNPQCKFLNLSSAAVYGSPDVQPVREEAPLRPISPYGYHKKAAEELASEFARVYNLRACSLRIFSAYGPGLRKQLFWDLYMKSVRSKEVSLHGTGDESRDYIFIGDLVRLMEIVATNAAFAGEAINAANGEEHSLRDVVSLFYDCLGWNGMFAFSGQTRKGDPKNWRADIGKVREMGYQPHTSMQEGLRSYIQWVENTPSPEVGL